MEGDGGELAKSDGNRIAVRTVHGARAPNAIGGWALQGCGFVGEAAGTVGAAGKRS